MNEQQFDHLLLDYVDGSLSSEKEREQVRLYAASSPEATQQLDRLQKSVRLIRSQVALVEPPASLDQAILQMAQQTAKNTQRSVASASLQPAQPQRTSGLEEDATWVPWFARWWTFPSFKPLVAFCTVCLVVGSVFVLVQPMMKQRSLWEQPQQDAPSSGSGLARKSPVPVVTPSIPSQDATTPQSKATERESQAVSRSPSASRVEEKVTQAPNSPSYEAVRKQETKKVSEDPEQTSAREPMPFAPPPPPARAAPEDIRNVGHPQKSPGYASGRALTQQEMRDDVAPSSPAPAPKRQRKRYRQNQQVYVMSGKKRKHRPQRKSKPVSRAQRKAKPRRHRAPRVVAWAKPVPAPPSTPSPKPAITSQIRGAARTVVAPPDPPGRPDLRPSPAPLGRGPESAKEDKTKDRGMDYDSSSSRAAGGKGLLQPQAGVSRSEGQPSIPSQQMQRASSLFKTS